jgi:16S rRNA (uracil1498-N3)-methyltransferase
MADRFYLPLEPVEGRATLDGPEAHHLLHVMRARVGDQVVLFDGRGGEYEATVELCGRREVVLAVGPREKVGRELPIRLAMGVALPKGERQKWLVEKITELGVAELVPLDTERSVADLKPKSLERLERTVIEASKQCGRNSLMQIAEPQPLGDFLTAASGTKLLAHPTGEPIAKVCPATITAASVVVGPEGGLTDTEIDLAITHGWTSVCLGASILRVETAAVALAAVIANSRP